MAQQQSHVPKFGNSENEENVPYTAYFDNAQKGRTSGGKMINPNDPEENPDMQMDRQSSADSSLSKGKPEGVIVVKPAPALESREEIDPPKVRKGRTSGGKMINPNDPEENPDMQIDRQSSADSSLSELVVEKMRDEIAFRRREQAYLHDVEMGVEGAANISSLIPKPKPKPKPRPDGPDPPVLVKRWWFGLFKK